VEPRVTNPNQLMKLLYVNADFPPLAGPGVWRGLGLAEACSQRRTQLTVICAHRSRWHDFHDPELLFKIPSGTRVCRVHAVHRRDVQRAKAALFRFPFGDAWRRIVDAASWRTEAAFPHDDIFWMLGAGLRALAMRRVDAVLTSGPPHGSHLVGYLLSRTRGVPWIMDYRDLWCDDEWQAGHTDRERAISRRLEDIFLERADAVVTVSPGCAAVLNRRREALKPSSPVRVITNGHGVPNEWRRPAPEAQPPNSRMRIHFNGTIQPASSGAVVLEAIALLRSGAHGDLPVFTFAKVTDRFQGLAADLGVSDLVRETGYLPQEESWATSAAADALLVLADAYSPISRGVIPAKTFEALALRRPILAVVPCDSDVHAVLPASNAVITADAASVNSVADAIIEIRRRFRAGMLNIASEDWHAPSRVDQGFAMLEIAEEIACSRKSPD
jgi:glycosyltransferase involved in cell wall biosynthesis